MRAILRDETARDHDAAHDAASQHTLSSREGYGAFLRAHRAALRQVLHWDTDYIPYYADCISDIESDLEMLGIPFANIEEDRPDSVLPPPLSVRYVVIGSHLGARLLLRDIEKIGDPVILRSTKYLTNLCRGTQWRVLLAELDAVDPSPANIAAHIAGAKRTFAAFTNALSQKDPVHVI